MVSDPSRLFEVVDEQVEHGPGVAELVHGVRPRLIGTEESAIFEAAARLLREPSAYQAMAHAANPYGDGRAAERIREVLFRHFGVNA